MKLFLDENLPKKLKRDLSEFEVYTVHELGWSGISNGKLLQKMLEQNFDVLITFNKNLHYQQNFEKYTLSVLVLNAEDNTYKTLSNLISDIRITLIGGLRNGPIIIEKI